MEERRGAVTRRGVPVTLLGPEIKVGQKAPDFTVLSNDMKEVSLAQTRGRVRVINVVHSVDTPVCDLQTQRFEKEAAGFPGALFYVVSMDLPFAQARYCGAHNIKNVRTLSDHREASFGTAYGVLIKESRLHCRAVFIVDRDDTVRYVEYVKEVGSHPDYDRAIDALRLVVAGNRVAPGAGASFRT